MSKDTYSSALFTYIRFSSFILKFPNDIKKYIYEFLENKSIRSLIFYTRITNLTINPLLYLTNINNVKYLNSTNKEFIALHFNGTPFMINVYKPVSKFIINTNKLLENNICKKKACNYDKEIFHLNNEKYNMKLKKNKLSKKKFLMKNNKEIKKKNILKKIDY